MPQKLPDYSSLLGHYVTFTVADRMSFCFLLPCSAKQYLVESGLNLAILDSKHKIDGSQILILQNDYKPPKKMNIKLM